jgi:hypothetical protein
MAQTHTVRGVATEVIRDSGSIIVRYHATNVVVVAMDGTITLNTGGWRTVTTKLRMNQAARQFHLGYRVCQKDFNWYVESTDQRWPWRVEFATDTLTLPIANYSRVA